MSKRVKVAIACVVVCLTVITCTLLVVLLLHSRNKSSIVETVSSSEENTESVAFDKFSDRLTDYVGYVVLSTYVKEEEYNRVLNTILPVYNEHSAIFIRSVDLSYEDYCENVVCHSYDSEKGMFDSFVIPVSESDTDEWKELLIDKVVLEEVRDSINTDR